MKKYFFYILVFIFSVVHSANSQYRIGMKGGINSCNLLGPDVPTDIHGQYGFNAGFYLDTRISEHMSTLFELNYSRYKFNYTELTEDSLDSQFITLKERNDYLNIPVMLRYKRGYEFVFFYLNAGMQFSLLVNNKRDITLTIDSLAFPYIPAENYEHNRLDYGLIGGAGLQFKAVNIDLKYYFSTRNMYNSLNAKEMRYNILSLELAYQFNYRNSSPFARKTGWKGLKYKIKHLFK